MRFTHVDLKICGATTREHMRFYVMLGFFLCVHCLFLDVGSSSCKKTWCLNIFCVIYRHICSFNMALESCQNVPCQKWTYVSKWSYICVLSARLEFLSCRLEMPS